MNTLDAPAAQIAQSILVGLAGRAQSVLGGL